MLRIVNTRVRGSGRDGAGLIGTKATSGAMPPFWLKRAQFNTRKRATVCAKMLTVGRHNFTTEQGVYWELSKVSSYISLNKTTTFFTIANLSISGFLNNTYFVRKAPVFSQ